MTRKLFFLCLKSRTNWLILSEIYFQFINVSRVILQISLKQITHILQRRWSQLKWHLTIFPTETATFLKGVKVVLARGFLRFLELFCCTYKVRILGSFHMFHPKHRLASTFTYTSEPFSIACRLPKPIFQAHAHHGRARDKQWEKHMILIRIFCFSYRHTAQLCKY